MCNKYNGWNNYETWNAMLWMNNVDGVMDNIIDGLGKQIDQFIDEGTWDKEGFVQYAETFIQDSFTNAFIYMDNDPASFHEEWYGPVSDAVSTYLEMVDWREIAHAVYEDNKDHWKEIV